MKEEGNLSFRSLKYGLAPSIVNELLHKSTSYSLRNSDFDIPTFTVTLLTMESILLDIKDLIYGRN